MVQIICAAMTAITTIVVAIIGKIIKNSTEAEKEKKELHRQETALQLEMLMASIELTEVCSNALTGGHNNGNVERAKQRVSDAKRKYRLFERGVVSDRIS